MRDFKGEEQLEHSLVLGTGSSRRLQSFFCAGGPLEGLEMGILVTPSLNGPSKSLSEVRGSLLFLRLNLPGDCSFDGCDELRPCAERLGQDIAGVDHVPWFKNSPGDVVSRGSFGRGGGLGFVYLSFGFIV